MYFQRAHKIYSQSNEVSTATLSLSAWLKVWISLLYTVIHFYFGADLISVISVQAFFT